MNVERNIYVCFSTRCGDVTASTIVASIVAAIEGRLTAERTIDRVDEYSVRVGVPAEVVAQ